MLYYDLFGKLKVQLITGLEDIQLNLMEREQEHKFGSPTFTLIQ